ncbi:MAG: CHAT domain-containing protein [Xenococcaceae cyanobacterium]
MNYIKLLLCFILGLILYFSAAFPGVTQSHGRDAVELVEVARYYYDRGNFAQAAKLLEEAVKTSENNGEMLQQIQARALLSLAQQKLGNWKQAADAIDRAMSVLAKISRDKEVDRVEAQILNIKGSLQLATGKSEDALKSWQRSETLYKNSGDRIGAIGTRLNQAEALENLGFYRRSCNLVLQTISSEGQTCDRLTQNNLEPIFQAIAKQPSSLQNLGWQSLGKSLLAIGKLEEAKEVLETTRKLPNQDSKKVLLELANVYKALAIQAKNLNNPSAVEQYSERTIAYYREIANEKSPSIVKLQAQLNLLSFLVASDRNPQAEALLSQISIDKLNLPLSRASIYAKLNLAQSLVTLSKRTQANARQWKQITTLLEQSFSDAIALDDKRSQSYALGFLGQIAYERNLSISSTPQQLLEQALQIAQAIEAPEIAYRWQWQLGRIYKNQSVKDAIASYKAAFANLQSLRSDLAALDREIQFSFQEQVEPVYRELVELLLPTEINDGYNEQKNLKNAREVIEALQVAELDNYFKDACAPFQRQTIENLDPTAAVFYTIVLPKRLEVIVSMPDGTLLRHSNFVDRDRIEITLEQLQKYLKEPDRLQDVRQLSHTVYNWLIAPFAKNLETAGDRQTNEIKTLVFVLDGLLKNLPMSVLYDGKQYLLERYAIALTPGLKLLGAKSPQPRQQLDALIAGISQEIKVGDRDFSPLENVENELKNIQSFISGETLINANLTKNNLERQLNLNPISIVHIATHGQFSSDPDKTFILLWNELLNVKDLNNLFSSGSNRGQKLIDLLVLSACETALGDRRATLGLAGVAVRAGARSTLATLWQVSDESTAQVMIEFYRQLHENASINKAEALRQAQLKLWQNTDRDWQVPSFWASYVIVGDWL